MELMNIVKIYSEDLPKDWNIAYISSTYKKGDKKNCDNYIGISITRSIGRLYSRYY